MRISQLRLRLLTGSILSAGLILTVACGEEDPFQDLRDSSSDEDSEGKDSDGKDSDGKDSDGKDSDGKSSDGSDSGGGDSTGKDSRGDSGNGSDGQDSSTDGKKDTTGSVDDSHGTDDGTTGGGGDTGSEPGNTDETTTEPEENPFCKLIPARLVVLGDATPAGAGVGGPTHGDNGVKIFHQRLKNQKGLDSLTFENKSENNSLFVDAESKQMPQVDEGGDGPVMILLHSGSSDLKKYILKSDQDARDDFDKEWTKAQAALDGIVAHFENKDKFPKGVVFVLNTIYNPFDDCVTSVPPISQTKIDLMGKFNQNIRDYAKGKSNFLVSDNHPALLGHGYNRNESSCPHYKSDAAPYVKENLFKTATDLNVAGQKAYSEVLMSTYTKAFGGC